VNAYTNTVYMYIPLKPFQALDERSAEFVFSFSGCCDQGWNGKLQSKKHYIRE